MRESYSSESVLRVYKEAMRAWFAASFVFVSVLLAATSAEADELNDFQRARSAYESQEHRLAAERFEELLGGDVPRLTTRALVLESRKYLGASYLFLGRRADADHQFELLLRDDAQYELDPVAFPAEVLEVFNAVRARMANAAQQEEIRRREREEAARRAAADQLLMERSRMDRLLALATEERVEVQNQRWVAWMPFGAGQFQNGNTALGVVFLASETLLLATSVTTYIWHTTLPDSADLTIASRAEAAQRESQLATVNYVSVAALLGVAAIGIVDAHVRFVPATWETRHRELPDDLRPSVDVSLGLHGISVRGTF